MDISSVNTQASLSPTERESDAITLTPGDLLTGLSVFQIDRPHQRALVNSVLVAAREITSGAGIHNCALFCGSAGRDVAVFTQWANRSSYEQAQETLLKPPEQDLYQVVFVDNISGQNASSLSTAHGLFHFINVFEIAPGKRDAFVEFFRVPTSAVRVQPGYVSANLLVSLDGRHAVNIGQFQTRDDFQAMFRHPSVLRTFVEGLVRRTTPKPPRLRQYDLRAIFSYHDEHQQ